MLGMSSLREESGTKSCIGTTQGEAALKQLALRPVAESRPSLRPGRSQTLCPAPCYRFPGGLKERTARAQFQRQPEEVLRKAVYGMLPKNKLRAVGSAGLLLGVWKALEAAMHASLYC